MPVDSVCGDRRALLRSIADTFSLLSSLLSSLL